MADNVNPAHYADGWSNGAEVIDITENLNFNRGNAVKYIARAGRKDSSTELEDLRKAKWYLDREIERITDQVDLDPPEVDWVTLDYAEWQENQDRICWELALATARQDVLFEYGGRL